MCSISIILPVYNIEAYIEKCMESILNQTYRDFEVIIIDDGSSDRTGEICDQYTQKDSRIKVFHQENQGVSIARNKGLELALGEYICFIDGDDYIERNTLEVYMDKIVKTKAEAVISRFIKENNKKKKVRKEKDDYILSGKEVIREAIYGINGMSASLQNKFFRREVLEHVRFAEHVPIGEDYAFSCFIFANIKKALVIDEFLYHYVQRADSVSHGGAEVFVSKMRNTYANNIRTDKKMEEIFPELKRDFRAKLVMQELEILVSMVRGGKRDDALGKEISMNIRRELSGFLSLKEAPLSYKICACLAAIDYRCLLVPYKLFIHPIRNSRLVRR